MRHLMIVQSNPAEGREDEFNEWYENTHLDEVLTVPGIVRAHRYRVKDGSANPSGRRYLAVYEIEADDLDVVMKEMFAAAPNFKMSSAFDMSSAIILPFEGIGTVHTEKA